MNAPPPDNAQRVAATVELLAKVAGSLAALWVFFAKIARPFVDWRRHRLASAIRAAMGDELDCMKRMPALERGMNDKLDLVLLRQKEIFSEIDLFMQIATENNDRVNDLTDLLDGVGMASRDRREGIDRRQLIADALAELSDRRNARRRRDDQLRKAE